MFIGFSLIFKASGDKFFFFRLRIFKLSFLLRTLRSFWFCRVCIRTSSGEPSCPVSFEGFEGDLVPPLLTKSVSFYGFFITRSDALVINGLISGDLEVDVAIGIPPVVD